MRKLFSNAAQIVVWLVLFPNSGLSQDQPCVALERVSELQSFDFLKKKLIGLSKWSTDFALAGFDSCVVVSYPDTDPGVDGTDMINCIVLVEGLDAAREVRDRSIGSMSCGGEPIGVPDYGIDSRSYFFPKSGLGIIAEARPTFLPAQTWRNDLRKEDRRTQPYDFEVSISITGIFDGP